MADLLGLGQEARINTPGTVEHNWRYRMKPDDLTETLAESLAEITRRHGRAQP